MMVVPFLPHHIEALVGRDDAREVLGHVPDLGDYGRALFAPGLSFSGTENGFLVGCAGVVPLHPGLAEAWALFSVAPGASRLWLQIHRAVLGFLNSEGRRFRRIQTAVKDGFEPGHVWARKLGFGNPVLLDQWAPDGSDYWLYRRIQWQQ